MVCLKFREVDRSSDESEITSVYAAGEEDIDIAVKAARKALKDPSWKQLPATDRGNLMLKLADLIEEHKETLATIETWDNG
jgi:aldehyde dehydrogenase (NAD+)